MTEIQRTMARALAACSFVPGTGTKRFARDMRDRADQLEPKPLTPKQHEYLCTAVERFRRQIPGHVVAIARTEILLMRARRKGEADASVR